MGKLKNCVKKILPESTIKFLRKIKLLMKNFVFPFLLYRYNKEIKKREKLSIFDYKKLAKQLVIITKEHGYNAFYGHDHVIKKYLKLPSKTVLSCSIEHGPGPGTGLIDRIEFDVDNKYGNVIYVASNERKKMMEAYLPNKKIISIGLFIQYVDSLLNENEYNKKKQEMGKTLLVFPYHSIENVKINFSITDFLEEIRYRSKTFDTTIICMYYQDILLGNDKPFLDAGYKIATAGHAFDYNFLRRLRTIIELSDMTMSNAAGSQIGYCVCLNKPHYLFKQKVRYDMYSYGCKSEKEFAEEIANRTSIKKPNFSYYNEAMVEILKTFGFYHEYLTEKEKKIVRKYWGEWE